MMMMMMMLLAAATGGPLDTCSAAMRSLGTAPRAAIEAACPAPPPRDLWGGGEEGRCDGALAFARDAAATASGLPAAMVRGLVAEFDKREVECRKPPPPPGNRTTAQRLWD